MAEEVVEVKIKGDVESWRRAMLYYQRSILEMQRDTVKAMKGISSSTKKASQEQQTTIQQLGSAWKKYGSLIKTAVPLATFTGLALGIKRFKDEAMNEFAAFDKGIREVFTLIPEYASQMRESLTQDILALGVEFGRLTDETVPALYQAVSAGIPAENALTFLQVASEAARGGVSDLKTSVDVLTTIVNAYGKSADEASEVSDTLFAAVQGGKITFTEFAKSAANVVPIAAATGVAIEDVAAAMATMTKQGVPARTATTQLRQVLMHLSTDGKKAADIFRDAVGVSFEEFIAQGNNLRDAMAIMQRAAADAGVSVNELFGNIRAGMGALALTGTGLNLFSTEMERVQNSSGAMAEANAEMADSYEFVREKSAAATEALKISIGAALQPWGTAILEAGISAKTAAVDILTFNDALRGLIEGLQESPAGFETLKKEFEELDKLAQEMFDKPWWQILFKEGGPIFEGGPLAEELQKNTIEMMALSSSVVDFINRMHEVPGATVEGVHGMRNLEVQSEAAGTAALGAITDIELFIAAMSGGIPEILAFLEATTEYPSGATQVQYMRELAEGALEEARALEIAKRAGDAFALNREIRIQLATEEAAAENALAQVRADHIEVTEKASKSFAAMLSQSDNLNEVQKSLVNMASAAGAAEPQLLAMARSFGTLTKAEEELLIVTYQSDAAWLHLMNQVDDGNMTLGQAINEWRGLWEEELTAAQVAVETEQAHGKLTETLKYQGPTLDELREKWKQNQAAMGDYFTSLMDTKDEAGVFTVALENMGEQTVYSSNLTQQQSEDLVKLQEELVKAKEKADDFRLGIKSVGKEGKNLAANNAKIASLEKQIADLVAVGGDYVTVNNEVVFSQDALNQALYEAADAGDANAAVLGDLGVALGMFSEAERNAALQAVAMQMKIKELGQAIADGMSIDQALAELEEFQDRVGEDFEVVVTTGDTDATQEMADARKEAELLREEARMLGEEMPIEVEVEVKEATRDMGYLEDEFGRGTEEAEDFAGSVGDAADDVTDASKQFGGDIEGIADDTETALGDTADATQEIAEEAVGASDTLLIGYEENMGHLSTATKTGVSKAAQVGKKAKKEFFGVGGDLIQGMVEGLYSKQGSLYAAVAAIVQKALDTANETADTGSPSRETYKTGSDMGEGLFQGLFSWGGAINWLMYGMVSSAIDSGRRATASGYPLPSQYRPGSGAGGYGGGMPGVPPKWLSFGEWMKNTYVPGHLADGWGWVDYPSWDFGEGRGSLGGGGGWRQHGRAGQGFWEGMEELRVDWRRQRDDWLTKNYPGGRRAFDKNRWGGFTPTFGSGFGGEGGGTGTGGIPWDFGGGTGTGAAGDALGFDAIFEATEQQMQGLVLALMQQYGDMTREEANSLLKEAAEGGILNLPEGIPAEIRAMIEEMLSGGIIPIELLESLDMAIVDIELVLDLIEMLEPRTNQWFNAMNRVFDVASDLAGAASFFAGMFVDQILDPIEDAIDGIEDQMGDLMKDVLKVFDLSEEEVLERLPELIEYAESQGYDDLVTQLLEVQQLQIERNALEEEFAQEQERILEVQRQQQQLAFLQAQLDLLQTIRDAGLNPAEILEGITLGLDASLPDLIDAINIVIQRMIDEANEQLGIQSPSRVFWEMGQQSMRGLMEGALDTVGAMTEVMRDAVGPSGYAAPVSPGFGDTTVVINFGDTVLNDQMDAALFEDKIQSVVAEAL